MNATRLNITLPQEILKQLDRLAGPKGKSSFIAECIRLRIEKIEKEKLKNLLTWIIHNRVSQNSEVIDFKRLTRPQKMGFPNHA